MFKTEFFKLCDSCCIETSVNAELVTTNFIIKTFCVALHNPSIKSA